MASTVNPVKLADIQYLATVAGSIYANPASTETFIKSIILHNNDTVTRTATLYNVPDNSGAVRTATVAHQFFRQDLVPNETIILEFMVGLSLSDTNDTIQGLASSASKITVQLLGGRG